jgi:hypothetical protein
MKSFIRWLRNLTSARRPSPTRHRLRLEALEDRLVPSTLTVLNSADSGPGSLRDAIAAAHSGDTINFAPALAGQTITLTSGELAITKALAIQGPGADLLTVSGSYAGRVFDIAGRAGTVALTGLTVANGLALDSGGGLVNYASLAVSDCVFVNDYVGGESFTNGHQEVGGAVANYGTLSVTGTRFTLDGVSSWDSHALAAGGALANYGLLTVSGADFESNQVFLSGYTDRLGEGGALANFGTATVTDSIFSTNGFSGGVPGYGGAIENRGTLTVADSGFSSNGYVYLDNRLLLAPAVEGGAIHNRANLTVTDSFVGFNLAQFGGGIENRGTALVSGLDFEENGAVNEGGAIQNWGDIRVAATVVGHFIDGQSYGNVAGGYVFFGLTGQQGIGGGISNRGTMVLEGSSVAGNIAAGGSNLISGEFSPSPEGGGIANFGSLVIHNSTISANTLGGGDTILIGVGIANFGSLAIDGSTISDNLAFLDGTEQGAEGGGIANFGSLVVTGSVITGNGFTDFDGNPLGEGGGIANFGTSAIDASTVCGNFAALGADAFNTGSLTVNSDSTVCVLVSTQP